MFCKYCGPDVPAFQMETKDICKTCMAIHDPKRHAEIDPDTIKTVEDAEKRVEEKNSD